MTAQSYILGYSRGGGGKGTEVLNRHVRSYAGTLTNTAGGKSSTQSQYVLQCNQTLSEGAHIGILPTGKIGVTKLLEMKPIILTHTDGYKNNIVSEISRTVKTSPSKFSVASQYVIQCAEELCNGTQLTMRHDGNISVKRITAKEPKQQIAGVGDVLTGLSLRTLTPRESFRLMGLTESEIDTLQSSGLSRCQQYKLAGNSIVVDVLEEIFRKLFVDTANDDQQMTIFDNLKN